MNTTIFFFIQLNWSLNCTGQFGQVWSADAGHFSILSYFRLPNSTSLPLLLANYLNSVFITYSSA